MYFERRGSALHTWGLAAETVAERAVGEAKRYLDAGVPVSEHLADQLLLPLAIAGRGQFVTLPLSDHSTTHIELIGRFLGALLRGCFFGFSHFALGNGIVRSRCGSGSERCENAPLRCP